MIGPEGVFVVFGSVNVFEAAQTVSGRAPTQTTMVETAHAMHFAAASLLDDKLNKIVGEDSLK